MSQSLSGIEMEKLINKGLPVPLLGLNFYPISMIYYDEFLSCKDVLLLRLRTLPVEYMIKDYFSAIFAFEIDSAQKQDKRAGMLQKLMRLFFLSLRINEEDASCSISFDLKNNMGKSEVQFIVVNQDEKQINITPIEFSIKVRPLIAKLNGLELPNESENLDLVIANEQKKKFNSSNVRLNVNTHDLIASVAYLSGCREREIYEWTVREFETRVKAIERDKRYTLYSQAESSGFVTFKNGNPAPSWCYDILDDSLGTQSLSELNFGNTKQKNN